MEETGKGTVLVAVPGPELAFSVTRPAIARVKAPPGSFRVDKPGHRSEYARTELIDHFLIETQHEWIFLLDSDMQPEEDTLQRLLEHQKPIITGLYLYRGKPAFPAIRRDYDAYAARGWPSEAFLDFPKDALFRVGAVPFGALLVHRSAFVQAAPVFHGVGRVLGLNGQLPWAYYGAYRGRAGGGDLVFSDLMKIAGLELWCDSSVFVPHLTADYLTLEEYDADAAQLSIEEGKRA